ncbi:hypothetical protein SANTM175S_06128 [Streptomyces antimycoticus]
MVEAALGHPGGDFPAGPAEACGLVDDDRAAACRRTEAHAVVVEGDERAQIDDVQIQALGPAASAASRHTGTEGP